MPVVQRYLPPAAQWVTTDPTFGALPPLDQAQHANIYWFQDVHVPASAAGNFTLDVTVAADNAARLFINGIDLGTISTTFHSANTITIPANAFVAGDNVIMIRLFEAGVGTPRGLLVMPGTNQVLSNCVDICTSDLECDDGNECTADDCNMAGACTNTAVANGTACTNGTCDTTAAPICEGVCGDNLLAANETCDDGAINGDEQCDDDNLDSDDGCSAMCEQEAGWDCAGEPSGCDLLCGDGITAGAEACDDNNVEANDGCSATCVVESDRDADGVVDAIDNCPDVANADQRDVDGDDVGDACDVDNDNNGFVDGSSVAGGTGCNAGGTAGGSAAMALLVMALIMLPRFAIRRRRR